MQMLGIDLGTSYIKGGVLDLEAHTITHITRRAFPAPSPGLPPLHHEVEPEAVIDATKTLLNELIDHAPHSVGILISSQMHGFVLTDAEGAPLTRIITWQDQRALAPEIATGGSPAPKDHTAPTRPNTAFAALEDTLSQDEILALGNGFKASLPLCALFTLQRQGKLPAKSSVIWSLSDYVFARLAGSPETRVGGASCVEPTLAASMGAYDFATGDWRHATLEKLGLHSLTWPRIVSASTQIGTVELNGSRLPVYPALGDHQCATLGSLLQPGELALNISTGSQVSLLSDAWAANPDYESRPYFGGRYLNTVTRVPAGRALTALVHLLTEIPRRQNTDLDDPWQTIAQAVADTPETDLQVNLSVFASPFGDSGAITHMHEANMTVGHLFRAAFAHMAQNYAQCARWLGWGGADKSASGGLVFAGGLAQRYDALRTAVAAQLQAGYRTSPNLEDTLFGLLAMGLVITQAAPDLDAAVTQLSHTQMD